MDVAAERGDLATVVRLASIAERALFIAGRWEAWHHALGQGLAAAKTSADRAAEAFFSHQQGTLAFCRDQLDEAHRLLQHALTLREHIGDDAGADVTRHNLRLLEPPHPPRPPRHRVPRRALAMAGSALATLALAAGAIASASALRSGQPHGGQPTGRPSMSPAAASSPSQPSNPGRAQGHGQRDLQLTPQTLSAVTVGTAESQQITATGGTPPYIFSWSGDPPGLTLSSSGLISGAPATAGSFQFTMKATDTSGRSSGSQSYTLQVGPTPVTITLSPPQLPATNGCSGYKAQITAGGGTPPYIFSWSGDPPPGLTLSTSGAISGAPTAVDSYQFTITATDSSATPNSESQSYTLAEDCTYVGY
jgi:hypothetical protein